MVIGPKGEGITIFHILTPTEDSEAIRIGLQTLQNIDETTKEAFKKIQILVGDLSRSHIRGWNEATEGQEVKKVACNWHFDNAIKEKKFEDRARKLIDDMRLAPDVQSFQSLFQIFEEEYGNDPKGASFIKCYGPNGIFATPDMWSHAFNDNGHVMHNMFIEAYHRVVKIVDANAKTRLDGLIQRLCNLEEQKYKDIYLRMNDKKNVEKTAAEKKMIKSHPKDASMFKISCSGKNNYVIHNEKRGTSYQMVVFDEENRICSTEYCKLHCVDCKNPKICAHAIKCSCPKYRFDLNCIHLHALSMKLSKDGSDIPVEGEKVTKKVGFVDPLETLKKGEQKINEETQEQVVASQLKSFLNVLTHKAESEEKNAFISLLATRLKDIKVPIELVQANDKNPSGMKVVNYNYNKPGRNKNPETWRQLSSAIVEIIQEGLLDGKDDEAWQKILNIPKQSVLSQCQLPSQQVPQFEKEYDTARQFWLCHKCFDFKEADFDSGYIECAGKSLTFKFSCNIFQCLKRFSDCDKWFHKSCTTGQVQGTFNCGICNQILIPNDTPSK